MKVRLAVELVRLISLDLASPNEEYIGRGPRTKNADRLVQATS